MKPLDPSTDYGCYPTLAPLPEELLGRFARCEHCGSADFRFRLPDWTAVCKKCGNELAVCAPSSVPKKLEELSHIQISGTRLHTVLLRPDGTVRARGKNEYGECNVSDWTDIISIATSKFNTVGLRRDGTVVMVGIDSAKHDFKDWSDITAICASSRHVAGLRKNGTVVITDRGFSASFVRNWYNITQIGQAYACWVGLKADGSISVAGALNDIYNKASKWSHIRAIAPGLLHLLALREDGTVAAAGDSSCNKCSVHNWTDITDLSAYSHSVGLRKDGTVLAVGTNNAERCNVQHWTNVAKIWAGYNFTAAMQHDGTILCTDPIMKQWIIEALA